ncbi:MAG: cupin domain-containing protein [Bacteroidota bacterium]
MKQKINAGFIPALLMTFIFIACNNEKKKDEPANSEEKKTEAAAAPTRDPAMDAAKVAPGVYHVLADTMNIRLIEITVKPGESVPVHSHPDYSLYVIDGGKAEFVAKDGTKQTQELKAGMGMVTPSETHAAKNTGTTTLRIIATEVFRTAAATRDPAMDAAKVAPGVYKVLADTMNIRLVEITVKPGESVPLHSHPDYAEYVIDGGVVELVAKDGTKQSVELKPGFAAITPAETHSGKNTGTTTIRIIATEVFRGN